MELQILNGIVLAAIYILFSLGLTLSWGALDVLNLAHGAVFTLSAYVASQVAIDAGMPILFGVLLAACIGGVLTVLIDQVVFHRIRAKARNRQDLELITLIAGAGLATAIVGFVQLKTKTSPFGITFRPHHFSIFGLDVTSLQLAIIALGVVLPIALAFGIKRSRYGRAIRAIAFDRETCSTLGINPRPIAVATMFIAGALAGIAGFLLMAYLGALVPQAGEVLLIKAFAVLIIGSVGSIVGTVVGACVLAASETALVATTSGTLVDAVSFGIIAVVILVRPGGMFARGEVERA